MTGVGSRYVGFFVASIFALLGLLPIVGGMFKRYLNPLWRGHTGEVWLDRSCLAQHCSICGTRSAIHDYRSGFSGSGFAYAPEILNDKMPLIKDGCP